MKQSVMLWAIVVLAAASAAARPDEPATDKLLDVGSRRELFVDRTLIDRLTAGAELRLHHPVPREVVLVHDAPWEGNASAYHSVFQDGDRYRMYYRAWNL